VQLLKWIGNKQRFSKEIISYFPKKYNTYYEPFLGSRAILASLEPKKAIASDTLEPLIQLWNKLKINPEQLKTWYNNRYLLFLSNNQLAYEQIKSSYNQKPNPADLLFLCRSCYGGIIRFRKKDNYMSTPCGVHKPILLAL